MAEENPKSYLREAAVSASTAVVASWAVSAAIVVLAGGAASILGVARAAVRMWLVAIGAGISIGKTDVTVIPIGAWALATAVIALVIAKRLSRPVDSVTGFIVSTAGMVAVAAALGSYLASNDAVQIGVVRAVVSGFVTGGVGAAVALCLIRPSQLEPLGVVGPDFSHTVRHALRGVAVLLGSATFIVLVLLFVHRDRASELWALADPGYGGTVVLAIVNVLAIPTAVLWATSVLLGPGFAVGSGTSVDLTGAQLGPVPGFPALAALPPPGAFDSWVFLLGLLPLIAGACAGWGAGEGPALSTRLTGGVAAGAAAGLVVGLLVGLSGGALGPGRMATVGPTLVAPLVVAVAVMGLGGALGAMLAHYRDGRAS